jgi:hypothetical protein
LLTRWISIRTILAKKVARLIQIPKKKVALAISFVLIHVDVLAAVYTTVVSLKLILTFV